MEKGILWKSQHYQKKGPSRHWSTDIKQSTMPHSNKPGWQSSTQRGQTQNTPGCGNQLESCRGCEGQLQGCSARPPKQVSSTKFIGNCADLKGQVFDCSNYKQADSYVNTVKWISEYVGAEYKHGSNIWASIVNEDIFDIPWLAVPTMVDPNNPTADE